MKYTAKVGLAWCVMLLISIANVYYVYDAPLSILTVKQGCFVVLFYFSVTKVVQQIITHATEV